MRRRFPWVALAALLALSALLPRSASAAASYAYVATLFPEDEIIDVRLELPASSWQHLLDTATEEQYTAADVMINGKKAYNVGLRAKGNSSLTSVAGMDSDRYSLKISFDQYIDGQSLDGVTKLNLNNNFSDPSMLREYLSYKAFASIGVATPAMAFCRVYVNSELFGLYLAVEDVTNAGYLQRHFGDATGDLYKPDTMSGGGSVGSDLTWQGDDISAYDALNQKQGDASGEAILAMLDALNNDGSQAALESVLDVDAALKYFAVNTVLVNEDSYQGSMNHNYYLYEVDGVFTILPWDYNMSMGSFSGFTTDGGMGGMGMGRDRGAGGDASAQPSTQGTQSAQGAQAGTPEARTSAGDGAVASAANGGAAADGGGAATDANGDAATDAISVAATDANGGAATDAGDAATPTTGDSAPNATNGGSAATDAPQAAAQADGARRGGMGGQSCEYIDQGTDGGIEGRPLLTQLLAIPEYLERYHAYVQQVIDGYLNPDTLLPEIGRLADWIDASVQADPTKFVTYEAFREGVYGDEGIQAWVTARVQNVQDQLDGTIASKGATISNMGAFGGRRNADAGASSGNLWSRIWTDFVGDLQTAWALITGQASSGTGGMRWDRGQGFRGMQRDADTAGDAQATVPGAAQGGNAQANMPDAAQAGDAQVAVPDVAQGGDAGDRTLGSTEGQAEDGSNEDRMAANMQPPDRQAGGQLPQGGYAMPGASDAANGDDAQAQLPQGGFAMPDGFEIPDGFPMPGDVPMGGDAAQGGNAQMRGAFLGGANGIDATTFRCNLIYTAAGIVLIGALLLIMNRRGRSRFSV